MDPNACWIALIAALQSGDWDEAHYRAEDLYDWMAAEGRSPTNLPDGMTRLELRMFLDGIPKVTYIMRQLPR